MHIKHNTRACRGLSFSELRVGEVYVSLARSSRPNVYIACRRPAQSCGDAPDFLVNVTTGCMVVPADSVEFRHLPDATLDTGT